MRRHSDDYARAAAALDLARRRQELRMRWILLTTIVVSVLLTSVSTILHGPPTLTGALAQVGWIGLLTWIVKRLFGPPGPADGEWS